MSTTESSRRTCRRHGKEKMSLSRTCKEEITPQPSQGLASFTVCHNWRSIVGFMLSAPPPSTLAEDFLAALSSVFDPARGAIGDVSADVTFATRPAADGAPPVKAHRIVLFAAVQSSLCHQPTLECRCASTATATSCFRCYIGYISTSFRPAPPSKRCSACAPSLRRCSGYHPSIWPPRARSRSLGPSSACELLGVLARETSRARNAEGGALPAETHAALCQHVAELAAEIGLAAFVKTSAFSQLPSAQQAWLFAKVHGRHALHALAAWPGLEAPGGAPPPGTESAAAAAEATANARGEDHTDHVQGSIDFDPSALLQNLIAPPLSCALDGLGSELNVGADAGKSGRCRSRRSVQSRRRFRSPYRAITGGWPPCCLRPALHSIRLTPREGARSLHAAAQSGDALVCGYLAKRGAMVNASDADGASPLDVAVLNAHPAAATAIPGARRHSIYRCDGSSLIHRMAIEGRVDALALLVTSESVDVPNAAGWPPLQLACQHGHCEAARILLEARADVHSSMQRSEVGGGRNGSGTSSGGADGGADGGEDGKVDGPDGQRAGVETGVVRFLHAPPLHLASARGDAEMIELLLSHGASVASRHGGSSALQLCASIDPNCLRLLLRARASAEERDDEGRTPLHVAVASAPPLIVEGCVRALLENGARADAVETSSKQTAVHWLCERRGLGRPEAIETLDALVAYGATVNLQDRLGHTPLHLAIFNGHDELAMGLASIGASLNILSKDGCCALSPLPPPQESYPNAKAANRQLRAELLARVTQPEPWLPDGMSDRCQLCSHDFSSALRRHHCRHCGRIVCAACSPLKYTIPKFGVTKPTVRRSPCTSTPQFLVCPFESCPVS